MVQTASSQHAKRYFSDALSKADYYINDQELQGVFGGKLADRLGLGKVVTKDAFYALCENRHPQNGKRLTSRTNNNRTVGYDINFHCPKSVSIAHAVNNDSRILDVFRASVEATMRDIEAQVKTAIRGKGRNGTRLTGEIAWAEFIHQTARPVEGHLPDPHLHAHCFAFNATWDGKEKRFKAAQWRHIKQSMPFYQACFHKRLADRLSGLGYNIKLTEKSFELEAVPKEIIDHFSKRTDEIGRIAREKGITDAKELDALGAKTRSKKQKGLSMNELKKDWQQQIANLKIKNSKKEQPEQEAGNRKIPVTCDTILDQTLKHCFERASVINRNKLLATAYRFAIGFSDISIADLAKGFDEDKRIIRINQGEQILFTTIDVLREEQEMVDLAKQAIGKVKPLTLDVPDDKDDQQQKAINEVLTSRDRVCIIRGVAGSGKTTLMKKAISKIEESGIRVTVVAPTASASRGVLRSDGHKNAETVAKLLSDKTMQNELRNALLWVDEAGLLSTKDMLALLKLTKEKNARLVLGGDTRQHSAVTRGDALRILNTVAKLPTAEVNVIRRQQNEAYRLAVEDLSKGDIAAGFERLDRIGSIKTIDKENPAEELVKRYMNAIKEKRSVLVVSPTHEQGESITNAIRDRLKTKGLIGKKAIKAKRLVNRNMTEAEKSDARSYRAGDAIQFNQNLKGFGRGSLWTISENDGRTIYLINKEGKKKHLPISSPERFDVFSISSIDLAKGDKVRVTKNSYEPKSKSTGKEENSLKPKRMDNGLSLEVVSVYKNGNIRLRNTISKTDYLINDDFGHITHEYCVTSHASQGKTCDEVLIYQPSATFGATNSKQFYVSASRAKHIVRVFTDDREELLDHAKTIGDRQSAIELIQANKLETELVLQKKRMEKARPQEKTVEHSQSIYQRKARGYEPAL
jgi:conjugative relaxase-like TrwC/TraI family protein